MFRRPKKVLCFCGGGQNVVKVVGEGGGGGLLFFFIIIPFGSWGKISTGTSSCLLLQLQYLFILL